MCILFNHISYYVQCMNVTVLMNSMTMVDNIFFQTEEVYYVYRCSLLAFRLF